MYERILVGTDGSATAARAVDRAVEVAEATKAELTIMCVGSPERTTRVLDAELARLGPVPVEIRTAASEGDPASCLVEAAAGFDLLVVGNKGMTGASRFFLGSVPNKVSHHVPCSMLIVRTT